MPGFLECWRCQKRSIVVECDRCQVAKYCSKGCQQSDQWRHKSDCEAAIKVCRACSKKADSLKNCSACCQAYYCGVECQTKDRPKHKGNCKAVERKIKCLSKKISMFFAVPNMQRVITKLYYWGNYPAYDYLNLEENEGLDYETPLSVLVLGAGDLRNVVLTCASLPKNPKTDLKFTLNDIEPCTLARLILLLYMIIQGEPDHVNQVTEVWYSTQLNDETYQSLCLFLRELSEMRSSEQLKLKTNGLLSIDEEHLNEMRRVWKTWLDLPVLRSKWISEQRKEAFERDPGSKYGISSYYSSIPSEHVKSAKKWMEDGVFVETRASLVAENPTLTGCPKVMTGMQYSFCFDSSILPFSGWDYLEVKKFKHCNSIVQMYTAYVNEILRRSKETLSSGRVSFKAVLANCMDLSQHLSPEENYDRILTTNLSDYILLPHLLKLCSKQLNHSNSKATIVTETQNWTRDFCPDAAFAAIIPMPPTPEMRNRVIKDTGSSSLLKDGGLVTYIDYLDNSKQFIEYLRATFYAIPDELTPSQTSTRLPSLKQVANKFGLELRDFLRNKNRIAYFKLALNCRRPSMISGYERVLEWIPMK